MEKEKRPDQNLTYKKRTWLLDAINVVHSRMSLAFLLAFLLVLFLAFPVYVLGLSAQEVRERSKVDPEAAWDMYLMLLQQSAEPESLEGLGRFVFAKRKLKNLKFVVEENLSELVTYLSKEKVDARTRSYLMEVFGDERLNEYVRENIEKDHRVLHLLTLLPVIEEDTLEAVVRKLLVDPASRKLLFANLRKSVLHIGRITDRLFSKMLELSRTSVSKAEMQRYIQPYLDVRNLTAGEFSDPELDKLAGLKVNSGKGARGSPNLTLFNQFSRLIPSLGRMLLVVLPVVVVFIAVAVLFVVPALRYQVYRVLGMKRQAAIVFRKIVEKDPLNEEKRLKLAQLYEEAGMVEEALNEYSFLQRIKLE